jgi:hypothetical protein
MKKIFTLILISLFSLSTFSQDVSGVVKKKSKKKHKVKVTAVVPAAIPCDSKEDILKKLEEKNKEGGHPKAFSLQGGDTGCKAK